MRKPAQPLTETHPHLVAEWVYAVGSDRGPADAGKGSKDIVRWRCSIDARHEWEAVVSSRAAAKNPRGCPYCAGQRVLPAHSLAALRHDLAVEFDHELNAARGGPLPTDIGPGSRYKASWRCRTDPAHIWEERVYERAARKDPRCKICLSVACQHPELMPEWDEVENARRKLDPFKLRPGSDRKARWICAADPTHTWDSPIKKRARVGRGCHYCAGQLATPETCLASHPAVDRLLKEWHPTANLPRTPETTTAKSGFAATWRCLDFPHHRPWTAQVYNRTLQGTGECPECRSISHCRPDLMAEWDPGENGGLDPRVLSLGSSALVAWRCKNNPEHQWMARIADRTGGTEADSTGNECPYCSLHHRSKKEIRIGFELRALLAPWFDVEVDPERVKVDDGGRPIQVDLTIPGLELVIEYDGFYWHQDNAEADAGKTNRLRAAGLRVARIREGLPPLAGLDVEVARGATVKACVVGFIRHTLLDSGLLAVHAGEDAARSAKDELEAYVEQQGYRARAEADAFLATALPQ